MDRDDVKKYLTEDEEGKNILEGLKAPLLKKRDELLTQIHDLGQQLSKANQEAADNKRLLLDERAAVKKIVIDDGLRRELKRIGIPSTHEDALLAHLKANHKITVHADGTQREAVIGEQKLSDFLEEWKGTDEAKALIPAPINSGGAAPGSTESGEKPSFRENLLKELGV